VIVVVVVVVVVVSSIARKKSFHPSREKSLKVEPARGRAGAEGELVALDLGHEVLRVVVL
jgi:hypothetical protein